MGGRRGGWREIEEGWEERRGSVKRGGERKGCEERRGRVERGREEGVGGG